MRIHYWDLKVASICPTASMSLMSVLIHLDCKCCVIYTILLVVLVVCVFIHSKKPTHWPILKDNHWLQPESLLFFSPCSRETPWSSTRTKSSTYWTDLPFKPPCLPFNPQSVNNERLSHLETTDSSILWK